MASPHGREGRGVRRRTAARQSRHHRRCTTTAAAEAEAAATDADKVGGAPVWEGAQPVAFGAACGGQQAESISTNGANRPTQLPRVLNVWRCHYWLAKRRAKTKKITSQAWARLDVSGGGPLWWHRGPRTCLPQSHPGALSMQFNSKHSHSTVTACCKLLWNLFGSDHSLATRHIPSDALQSFYGAFL